MQKRLSELQLRPIEHVAVSIHSRKDYPVKDEPIKVVCGTDGKHYVIGNMGKFFHARKNAPPDSTIEVKILPFPPSDPRISRETAMDLFEAPMSIQEAEQLYPVWQKTLERAIEFGIISERSEWDIPQVYGLIPELFDAYTSKKLKSALARFIQKLPPEAQEIMAEKLSNIKLSPAMCEALLEIFRSQGIDILKQVLSNPNQLIQIDKDHQTKTKEKKSEKPAIANQTVLVGEYSEPAQISTLEEMALELRIEETNIEAANVMEHNAWFLRARALANIMVKKLYRARGYNDFDRYCHETLNINAKTAHRHIEVYQIIAPSLAASLGTAARQLPPSDRGTFPLEAIKMSWQKARALLALPDEHKESLKLRGCVFLEDGKQLTLEDFKAMTTKELRNTIDRLQEQVASIQDSSREEIEKLKKEFEEKEEHHSFVCDELQADINTLRRRLNKSHTQLEELTEKLKKKEELIEEMAARAHEQQQIGAAEARKKAEREIAQLKSNIDFLKKKEKSLEERLNNMTRLHAEAVQQQEHLKKLTPEQLVDMQVREKVYRWIVGKQLLPAPEAKRLVDNIGDNYEEISDSAQEEERRITTEAEKDNRDSTIAYAAQWINRHVKGAIAYYAAKDHPIPLDDGSLLRCNVLIAELESTIKLLQTAMSWWQESNDIDFDTYQQTIFELARPAEQATTIPPGRLPLEVEEYMRSLNEL